MIVDTNLGKVRGQNRDGIYTFRGIPYGGPTGGKKRFLPPEKPQPWTGVLDALDYGPSCPQPTGPVFNVIPEIARLFDVPGRKIQPLSEDCLVLNIWTPGIGDGGRRPVMFWCHGGGFAIGSGSEPWYDGGALCRSGDVVVVTVNHRLGPFGYLYLGELIGEDYALSGDAGMLDLVLALEWVRDNIANFGGDPGNVTIFGESGGGWKVSTLMAMPAAMGLFHKAIIQSGPGLRMQTKLSATKSAQAVLSQLRIRPDEIARLQELPADELLAARQAASRFRPLLRIDPVVDGHALPQPPFDPVASPLAAGIPLMIGTNKDESTLFLGNFPFLGTFNEKSLLSPAALRVATAAIARGHFGTLLMAYRSTNPGVDPTHLFASLTADWVMRLPSILLAERKMAADPAPVYMYLFTWETPALKGKMRSHHALEIPFVFNNTYLVPEMENFPECILLAANMSRAWINFARCGNPDHPDLPHWSPYSLPERATMIFDKECMVMNDPGRAERLAWEGVKLYLM